jgi:anti-sigma factor RsiW
VKCDQVREWTSAALDGALTSNDSNSYFVHLQSCPPCRLHHEEMRAALALLTEVPSVEVSDTFEERVWTLIAEDRQAREQRWALPSWLRSFGATPAWMGWSFAGVSAAVVALALVSSDPAPLATIAHRANSTTEQVIASAPTTAPAPEKTAVDAEEEFVADMPEAIRVYLQQGGQDLRLPDSAERYRRSNYTYPVRRVADPDPFRLTGESQNPSPAAGSDQDGTVIQF